MVKIKGLEWNKKDIEKQRIFLKDTIKYYKRELVIFNVALKDVIRGEEEVKNEN